MTTKNYHYVEWRYWDIDKKVAGEIAGTELYDRKKDRQENVNIASYPENAKLIKELAKELHEGWRAARPN